MENTAAQFPSDTKAVAMPPRRVSTSLQEDLLSSFESGMGYQIAEIQSELLTTWFLVLNAEVAFQLPEFMPTHQLDFWIHFQDIFNQGDIRWLYDSIEPAFPTPELEIAADLDELQGTVSRVLTHGSYVSTYPSRRIFPALQCLPSGTAE